MSFLLPPPPQIHGTRPGSKFVMPPLDGSLTLPQIFDFHYENNPDHPLFRYTKSSGENVDVPYSKAIPAAHRAARLIAGLASIDLDADLEAYPTVVILANTDSITYATVTLGLLRAGITTFLISPRCTPIAAAALLSQNRPTLILISPDAAMRELVESSIKELNASSPNGATPKIGLMPSFEQIYTDEPSSLILPLLKRNLDVPRLILHSSGSTSLPKPIPWNDRFMLQFMMAVQYAGHDLCGEICAFHGSPMFHTLAWGFMSCVAGSGTVLAFFEPASPPTIPTPDAVFEGLVKSSPTWGFVVPSFVEQWSTDEAKVEFLRTLKGLTHGGGPLSKFVGDTLTQKGVRLFTIYGATEFGVGNIMFGDYLGVDWEYLKINPHLAAEFVPVGDGTFEMIVVSKPTSELPKLNTKFKGQDAYATSDLLVQHPQNPELWRIVGRADDQITLSTGEKTSPVPLEAVICQDPHVSGAVMFGRGRVQNGVIVQPKAEYALDPTDETKVAEFRNLIWPKVEEMNASTLTHSRVFKEMILIASPAKPFSFTPKGTPRRAHIITDYESEIEAIYKAVDEQSQFEPPSEWTEESSLTFVSTVVNSVLERTTKESEDIFEGGCDSMQATWIRNSVMNALRKTPGVSVANVSSNIVYDHPTIASLAKYAFAIASGESAGAAAKSWSATDITDFLARYTKDFPQHVPSAPAAEKDVVLVTGTTGALGSALLARLVSTESVAKVYAFNRPSRQRIGVLERQKEALKSRGYDPEIASSPKVVMVEGELTGAGLGTEKTLEEEIRRSVTHIIHNAWRVDFNLSLASFETAISGVRGLVDFALSSPQPKPPRLQFTSSIGVLRNHSSQESVKEVPVDDPSIPLGQGYGESKWVAEMILHAAAKATTLRPMVVRVGQICGGLNGAWNTSDWVPSIVKSSIALGCLPDVKGVCSWIPLDLTAEALVENRNEDPSAITLVHPYSVPYSELFQAISKELGLPFASYSEWEGKLEEAASKISELNDSARSAQFAEEVPAATILEFFKGALGSESSVKNEDSEVFGLAAFETVQARKGSVALQNARRLSAQDARSWIGYWRSIGFLPNL